MFEGGAEACLAMDVVAGVGVHGVRTTRAGRR